VVGKGSDMLGAFVPSHHDDGTREGLDKNHQLVGNHPKVVGKCFVIECLVSLLIDDLTTVC
jgi:hypothetical protein